MKISIVNPFFNYMRGGAEVNDHNLGKAFIRMGHDVKYFSSSDPENQPKNNYPELQIHPVKLKFWYYSALRAKKITGKIMRHLFEVYFTKKLISQHKSSLAESDIILVTGRPVIGAKVKKAVPESYVFTAVRGKGSPRYNKHLKLVDRVIFWGGCEADKDPELLKKLNSLYLDGTIENDLFNTERTSKSHDSQIKLVFVGRLDPIKQVDGIITAVEKLNRDDVSLTIIGKGSVEDDLKIMAASTKIRDKIHFTGALPREEIARTLKMSDIFVLNSSSENHPLSLKEALACGCFAIAPNSGRIEKIIKESMFGLTFETNSHQALVNALEKTIAQNIFDKSKRPAPAPKYHTWEDNAERIINSI